MFSRRIPCAVLLLLLTGCAAAAEKPADNEPDVPPPTGEARSLVLPFDAYELSLEEYYVVNDANDILIRDCMRKRGHDWKVIDRPASIDEAKNRRRYGVIEPAVAKRFGYHAPQQLINPTGIKEKETKRERDLSPQEKSAALDPDNGCTTKSHKQLIGNAEADYKLFYELSEKAFKDAQRAPEVAEKIRAWSTCMRGKGFSYADPYGAVDDPRWWEHETAPASDEEIATAKVDVLCKQQTELVTMLFTVEKRLERELINQHPEYFQELKTAKQRHLAAAHAVLAHG